MKIFVPGKFLFQGKPVLYHRMFEIMCCILLIGCYEGKHEIGHFYKFFSLLEFILKTEIWFCMMSTIDLINI